jgi:hypothetical protein
LVFYLTGGRGEGVEFLEKLNFLWKNIIFHLIIPPLPEGGERYTVLPLSALPSVQDIFRRIFLSNCWWQKSDIGSQASYRYTILWVAFLDPSDSYFLFTDLVGCYTHWTYMHIFLSNYWWQRSDIWSQASYRYPISWEGFLDPSDSYFLFAEERGYHTCRWALAHSSSCLCFLYWPHKLTTKSFIKEVIEHFGPFHVD